MATNEHFIREADDWRFCIIRPSTTKPIWKMSYLTMAIPMRCLRRSKSRNGPRTGKTRAGCTAKSAATDAHLGDDLLALYLPGSGAVGGFELKATCSGSPGSSATMPLEIKVDLGWLCTMSKGHRERRVLTGQKHAARREAELWLTRLDLFVSEHRDLFTNCSGRRSSLRTRPSRARAAADAAPAR